MAYGDIPLPPSGNKQEEEERALELTLRSYAGGLAPGKAVSDDQHRAHEQAALGRTPQPAEDEDVVELKTLDVEYLVDWLLGAGMFDGQQKPSGSAVVAAAEDDPDMAFRLLDAERTAQGGVPRADVLAGLTDITNRKALA
jgi:hypothetical protein